MRFQEIIEAAGPARDPGSGRVVAAAIRARASLSPQAAEAVTSWQSHNWNTGTLEKAFSGQGRSDIRREIEAAFEPVRAVLRARHGDAVPLYRGQRTLRPGERDQGRTLFSWTSDPQVAREFGVGRPVREITDGEIAAAVASYRRTGFAKLGREKFLRSRDNPKFYWIYQDRELVTDGDDLEQHLRQKQEDQRDYNARLRARGKVHSQDIPLGDIVWVTNELRCKEYICKVNPLSAQEPVGESRQPISEMPITVSLRGDAAPGAFRQDDIALATSPKARAKVEKVWGRSGVDVDLVLLNTPGDEKHRAAVFAAAQEQGRIVGTAELGSLGIVPRPKAVTLLLTQNEGAERLPLTAWMIAHRMYHAIEIAVQASRDATGRLPKKGPPLNHAMAAITDQVLGTIGNLYQSPGRYYDTRLALAHAIGGTKAARDGRLANEGEILPEAFAQYVLTGKVRFRDPPAEIPLPATRSSPAAAMQVRFPAAVPIQLRAAEAAMEQAFATLLRHAKGKAFAL